MWRYGERSDELNEGTIQRALPLDRLARRRRLGPQQPAQVSGNGDDGTPNRGQTSSALTIA